MTAEEKQAIIEELLTSASNSLDITSLSAAESLEGISTFPAIQATTSGGTTSYALVKVPISLLTQAVQDVITNANTATSAARSAASGWAAAAVKMGSDIVVIEGDISNLQDADKSLSSLTAYAECSTAANVSAKAVTVPFFSLPTNGGCLHVKMANANTAASNVTLNINGTGAKGLLYNGSAVSATNTWEANEVLQIYYDGNNYQATNAQGGGGSAEPSYVVPTWSGYVGASNATEKENVNLNNLTRYSNKSGSVSITISSTSYLWFVVNREVRIESFGIEVPVQYMGIGEQNGLYYYKTYEQILPSMISVELIATDASQSDDSGGGDTPTPTPTAQKPTIVTPPQSATYNEGANPNDLTVVASVSDGGTLSFQWYKDNSPFGIADSGTAVNNGVQSSITPASVTATYYCVITNTKSGANSNTNQTTSVTITFREGSDSETDLTDFLLGKWINSEGEVEDNQDYCITPWYQATGEGENLLCFVNKIVNIVRTDSSTPKYAWQVRRNGTVTSYVRSIGGRRDLLTCVNGDEVRVVLKYASDALYKPQDYCYINVGGVQCFKGSKLEAAFINKMGNLQDCFGKAFEVNTTTHKISYVANDAYANIPSNADNSSIHCATWLTKAIQLISGHTYRIYTGWEHSNSQVTKWVAVPNEIVITEGAIPSNLGAADYKYGKITSYSTITGDGTYRNYLYCNFALAKLDDCFVYDETANEYIIKGSSVI